MTEKAQAKERIAELRAEIERHNRLYYIDAAPEITDREYDQLLQALEELEQEFPEFGSPSSPPNALAVRRWRVLRTSGTLLR